MVTQLVRLVKSVHVVYRQFGDISGEKCGALRGTYISRFDRTGLVLGITGARTRLSRDRHLVKDVAACKCLGKLEAPTVSAKAICQQDDLRGSGEQS